jgi:NADH dehydrogenase
VAKAEGAHKVVIIGSGFGGLFAARRLKRAAVSLTVIDRHTHHLFQPLLYQMATGILSEGEIAPAIRDILRHQANANVVLGEVTNIDLHAREITSRALDCEVITPYDSLIVAAGAESTYFGNDAFVEFAPSLKSIDDALEVRGRIFNAFEMAEIETDPVVQSEWLTFVIVGAGATGVEMAGQIAELAHYTLRSNFRKIDTASARIILIDGLPRVLSGLHERSSAKAAAHLQHIGVDIELGVMVRAIDDYGLEVVDADGKSKYIRARTKVWAAGVRASPLGAQLAAAAGLELDRSGRIAVAANCSLPTHPEVFVIGDMMSLNGLPGVAEVALQSGRHAAKEIIGSLRANSQPRPFRYHDLGTMASVSRSYAVAEIGWVRTAGFIGWLLWLFVHLMFLTGFKNRVATVFHWTISFVGGGRAQRVITTHQTHGRKELRRMSR